MTPRYAVYGLCALLAILAGLSGVDSCRRHQGAGNEHNAAVASGEAHAHQSQAQASDSQVADLAAKLQAREADLGRLNAERDALLRKLAAVRQPGSHPSGPNLSPVRPVGTDDSEPVSNADELDLLRATVAKDAEVIDALKVDSVVKDSLITALTKRGDEYKAEAEARERQALAQEAATKAWRESVTTSKWRGRVEGFAVGIASGYVAGRLR